MAPFTLADLKAQIDACPDGGAVALTSDLFAEAFPPGGTEQSALEAACDQNF